MNGGKFKWLFTAKSKQPELNMAIIDLSQGSAIFNFLKK